MDKDSHKENGGDTGLSTSSELPQDLEAQSLAKFDDQVAKGHLIYEPSTAETVEDQGFKLSFRFVPHLRRKPITPSDAPERKTGKGHNPFLNPKPEEILSEVGPSHLLILNKFSVYRPSLLVITRHFAPQSDDLDFSDLSAAWAILQHFKQRYMMIYNCGFESGSSQGHKHLQFWPYPDEQELGFQLFPNVAESTVNITDDIPTVPHKHFVLRLPTHCDANTLIQAYGKLVARVRHSHAEAGGGTDYNVILITHSEWASSDAYSASAGAGVRADTSHHAAFKRLPFNFCALSLQPFTTPVCTAEGIIFDHENILRWLLKHDTNPTNGKPLKQQDLIKLNFAKNDSDEYVDPVTFKVFTDNTHIVAVRHGESANVFAYDTVERLNIKPKMWRDLVSDEEFTRKDLITLQDPQNLESRNLTSFKYLKDGEDSGIPKEEASINTASLGSAADLKIMKAKEAVAKARAERANAAGQNSKSLSAATSINSVNKTSSTSQSSKTIPYNATRHTTGQAAASFTSTGLTPHTSNALATMTDEEYILKPRRVKHKGYVRLTTTLGPLTLELNPEYAPKAVWNFVKLAQKGYYDGIIFHRNIRNFMIQSGDPTGSGRGGTSIWGKNFNDELEGPLKHDKRGVLSMANKGKNTNSSQFFITYRPASHLDHKHTIFGRVAEDAEDGGDSMETLKRLENAPVDSTDRPTEEIKIVEATVLIDPFDEFWKQKNQAERSEKEKSDRKAAVTDPGSLGVDEDRTTWTGKRIRDDGTVESGGGAGQVGKYLKASLSRHGQDNDEDEIVEVIDDEPEQPVRKKTKGGGGGFGNFDSW
ncbi:hypothetical protein AYO20_07193 [Fonsecaea nubica]|uniref:Peptidyl-prolyl cis-trans isomerase-like 2 n=1 Tax=Fonsecaea nubica TaxID=856822 RepID=A0A178CVL1_9EURO|nr:hypothetical protein AYO20_07193 [Fonsecaea nubica]OAL33507.1 hypothetical protein AYO20_07193 [Fonsecaea nubica]